MVEGQQVLDEEVVVPIFACPRTGWLIVLLWPGAEAVRPSVAQAFLPMEAMEAFLAEAEGVIVRLFQVPLAALLLLAAQNRTIPAPLPARAPSARAALRAVARTVPVVAATTEVAVPTVALVAGAQAIPSIP
jgi:hypothetical protein